MFWKKLVVQDNITYCKCIRGWNGSFFSTRLQIFLNLTLMNSLLTFFLSNSTDYMWHALIWTYCGHSRLVWKKSYLFFPDSGYLWLTTEKQSHTSSIFGHREKSDFFVLSATEKVVSFFFRRHKRVVLHFFLFRRKNITLFP